MKSDAKVVVSLTHPVPVKARGVLLSESCELRCEVFVSRVVSFRTASDQPQKDARAHQVRGEAS